jgi:peptide-methionine (S)-S-oxide reductase
MIRCLIAFTVIFLAGCGPALSQDKPASTQPTTQESDMNLQTATFAAGCFWGVQSTFDRVPGVVSTRVGYTGGKMVNPTYRDVCGDQTGHAEALEIKFDPQKVTYQQLLTVFFENHDPTTVDSQGPDFGTQYRSAIFYHSDEQKRLAEAEKKTRNDSGDYVHPIVTEIVAAGPFYAAEDHHQKYFEKMGEEYVCHTGNGKKVAAR